MSRRRAKLVAMTTTPSQWSCRACWRRWKSCSSNECGLTMATSLKHELRTPLNHIIGYCEMLMEEAEDGALAAYLPDLERIHGAGKRLLAVINDLFDPDRGEFYRSNQPRLDHEVRTPLNQIIGYTEMLQEESQALGNE